jgi:hypothetical protein
MKKLTNFEKNLIDLLKSTNSFGKAYDRLKERVCDERWHIDFLTVYDVDDEETYSEYDLEISEMLYEKFRMGNFNYALVCDNLDEGECKIVLLDIEE